MIEERPCRFFGDLLGGFVNRVNGAEAAVQIVILCSEKEASAGARGTHAQGFDAQIDAHHRAGMGHRSAMRCGISAGKFAATARPKIRKSGPRSSSSRGLSIARWAPRPRIRARTSPFPT